VVAVLAGLIAFSVYFRTLAASISWGDSPELTSAAYFAGVPHPTGYPLYMTLAHVFMRVWPFGSIAHRMNLLAALSGAAAVALIYLLLLRSSHSRWASLVTALAFAFSTTFWSQAVIAEHYPFEILCIAGVLGCVLTWDRRGERHWLFTSALVYGLCLTHHMMSLLLAPGLLYFALTSPHRRQFLRELPRTIPLVLLPLSLYLYLPLAALRDPPMNWGDPRTWDRFIRHVTGRQYHSAMFHMTHAQLRDHIRDYLGLGLKGHAPGFLRAQFGPGFFWLAPLGLWSMARHRPRLFGLTLLIYAADVLYALNYYIYNVEIYYLPSHLMVAIWIACALRQLAVWLNLLWRRIAVPAARRKLLNRAPGATLLVMPVSLLFANWQLNDHHNDWSALMYGRAALAGLKPNALLLAGGDWYYFPLMYTHYVERRRPDVTMLGFYDMIQPERLRLTTRLRSQGLYVRVPPGFGRKIAKNDEDDRLVRAVVDDNVGRRPVYVLGPPESLQTPWLAAILARYYRVVASNVSAMELSRHAPPLAVAQPHPQQPRSVRFGLRQPDGRVGNGMEFLGYDVDPVRTGGVPWLRISYYWRVRNQALARPAKVWVIFARPDGTYQKKADGSPDFQNIHPLGYGAGQGPARLPSTMRETFDIYVPPEQWNQPLHLRMAVAFGELFLAHGPGRDPWVDLGELPVSRGVP
jgi:hypothetical protein